MPGPTTFFANQKRRKVAFVIFLTAAFLFRLWFGLCSQFQDSDVKQIYLLGLKYYTTGAWPYFGPDVVWGEIQIPGALQGLLVGVPFFLLPLPEAPYVLLNALSFASLSLFAWYCCKRLPELPKWLVWVWLFTAPWVLDLSTTIYNPSYLLTGSIFFFVGLFEVLPFTRREILPHTLAFGMMGFGLLWSMQLHMSWILLIPYFLSAIYFQIRRRQSIWSNLICFLVGAVVPGSLLIPTYLKYGLSEGSGGTASTLMFNVDNLSAFPGILVRSLSFASFEVPRLLGPHTPQRIAFLREEIWLSPFVVFLFVVGTAQVIALVIFWFMRNKHNDWKAIKYLTLVNICLTFISFLFSIKPPQSNHLYITLPIPMIYSMYCWSQILAKRQWQLFAKVVLACGVIFHVGLALHNRSRISLYPERQVIKAAIELRDYRLLGERRPNTRY